MASPRHGLPGLSGREPRRVADVQLRGRAGPLRAHVRWPTGPIRDHAPPLLVFFPAVGPGSGNVVSADGVGDLGARAGVVVLSVPYGSAFHDATAAVEWAADHAAELDADPGRLLVGGEGAGGALAAAIALSARDRRWPWLTRQVLVVPDLDAGVADDSYAWPLHAPSVAGVAPATVVTVEHDPRRDGGRRYAARLRNAGVEVEELRAGAVIEVADALLATFAMNAS